MSSATTSMSGLHTVTLACVAPQAWRNGGGMTQELLAWPQLDDWALRISVARIDRNGPFSAFAGVQRSFCVLHGAGVHLRWPHRDVPVMLGDAPLEFDGAAPPGCDLIDGPTTDLNLMVRSASGQGRLLAVGTGTHWKSAAPWRGVYTAERALLSMNGGEAHTLAAHSFSWSTHAASQTWTLEGPTLAWWVEFRPHHAKSQHKPAS